MKKTLSVLALILLAACSNERAMDFELTEEGLKSLDSAIIKVEVTRQMDGYTSLVDIRVIRDPVYGGQIEWNGVAQHSHKMLSNLLRKPEVSRARITYITSQNKGLDWAQVALVRNELPSNWQDLTYLEFFARLEAVPGTLESSKWLCDFYAKYHSAATASWLPSTCQE